ncbi:MAG TPA: glycoside hydrolase, partial [Anaerolineae bacterium]|nr:glycoside hydrolase [Anaerolineae bacterium]
MTCVISGVSNSVYTVKIMRIYSFLALIIGLFFLGLFSAEASPTRQTAPPPNSDYRRLRDLPVLVDERNGQWIGAGNGLEIATESVCQQPYFPLDGDYQGHPAYHILVTGEAEGGWWSAILAGNDWESYSIAPYHPNGALEFNIRGAVGGEDMQIAVQDIDFRRAEKNTTSNEVKVSDYISVTTIWQPVSIPITDLIPSGGGFKLEQINGITLAGTSTKPVEMWINNLRWTSADLEPAFPAVKINQLGYPLNSAKYAYVSGFADEMTAREGTPFEVREIGNNQIAYSGELELVTAFDAGASGEYVLRADFSPITTPGDYYLAVSAYRIDDSAPFVIGDGLYQELLTDATRYFYLQRQGIALDSNYAGIFARGVGHPQDAAVQLRSDENSLHDVSQGWYDAGDYGKYVNAGAVALSDLLWAYEL